MRGGRQLALAAVAGALGLVLGGCPPQYPNCRTDEDCHRVNPSEVCVDGQCRQCRDDSGPARCPTHATYAIGAGRRLQSSLVS